MIQLYIHIYIYIYIYMSYVIWKVLRLLLVYLCVRDISLVNLQVGRNMIFLWFNGQLLCVKVTQCNDWNLSSIQVLEAKKLYVTVTMPKSLLKCIDRPFNWRSYTGNKLTKIAKFMAPTGGPSGADKSQVSLKLAPWTLLSGKSPMFCTSSCPGT